MRKGLKRAVIGGAIGAVGLLTAATSSLAGTSTSREYISDNVMGGGDIINDGLMVRDSFSTSLDAPFLKDGEEISLWAWNNQSLNKCYSPAEKNIGNEIGFH